MPKEFQIRLDKRLRLPLERYAELNRRTASKQAEDAVVRQLVSAKIIEKDFLKKPRA